MSRFSVALSPFYGRDEWKDEVSGITFEKDQNGQLRVYNIPEDVDLTNILKALRLNVLILVDGSLEELEKKHKEQKKEEEVAPVQEEEPVKETEAEDTEEEKSKGKKKTAKKK